MSFIPKFLLQRLYASGSLRQTSEGAAFDIVNRMGPGILTRIHKMLLDETLFTPDHIVLQLDEQRVHAGEISDTRPLIIPHHQTVTCILLGATLTPGKHIITVDLQSREAGKLVVTIEDHYAS